MSRKQIASEEYCISCECQLLLPAEKFGPVCGSCFKKTRRRDPLTAAAIAQAVVAVVPVLCPHEDQPHGRCRFGSSTAGHFNIIVLDKNLEPQEITGPYTMREADRRAKKLRKKMDRRRK